MDDRSRLENEYWKQRTNAKELYLSIKHVECWAFKHEKVVFNSAGFTHLIRKGASLRPRKEQVRRFSLLKYAVAVLKEDSLLRNNWKGQTAEFWIFNKRFGNKIVIVVVRQVYGGIKHFFSIMDVILPSKNPPRETL